MKIHDEETRKEKQERLSLIDNVQREELLKQLTYLLIIFAASILLCVFLINRYNNRPIGNPYECSKCRDFGRACSEHKELNKEDYLKEKIYTSVINFNRLEAEDYNKGLELHQYYIYGENSYNLDCDFCSELQSECEGCRYTRLSLIEHIKEAIDDNKKFLCSNCKIMGYPQCTYDIGFIVNSAYDKITSK